MKAGHVGLGSVLAAGITACGLALFAMLATNPAQIGPYGVTLWFLVLLTGLACLSTLGFYWLAGKLNKKPGGLKFYPAARRGMLFSGWITILIGLSSLQQLSWRDVFLTALLLGLAEFYFGAKA